MGKRFGNLQRLTGVIYYSLSPQELNPFKGILFPGIHHTFRRLIVRNLIPIGIPAGFWSLVFYYVHEDYKQFNRKNPEDYKDDV